MKSRALRSLPAGLVAFIALLCLSACRAQGPAPTDAPPRPGAPPPPIGGDALIEVPQRGLPETGFRFDPTGRLIGELAKDRPGHWDLWSLEAGAYVGQVPEARCRDWVTGTFRSLQEEKDRPMPPQAGPVLSPDGRLCAVPGPGRVEIVEVASGKGVVTLPLLSDDRLEPGLLVFGPAGVTALARLEKRYKEAHEAGHALYHWPGPLRAGAPPAPRSTFVGSSVTSNEAAMLDPRGRFLFVSQHVERVGNHMEVLDAQSGAPSSLRWGATSPSGMAGVESRFLPGRWRGGGHPCWETIEVVEPPSDDMKPWRITWRVLAAPGDRRLVRLDPMDGSSPSSVRARTRARSPGLSQGEVRDLMARFTGARMDTLRRTADGEELTLEEDGCATTARGAFSCTVRELRRRVLRLAEDPMQAPVVRGDQVAARYHDPQLVEHFFAGVPLRPRPLPAGRPGLPPKLALRGVEHRGGDAQNLVLRVLAEDAGDGVGEARAVLGLRPSPDHFPLRPGQETTLALTLPPEGCFLVRLYACNRQGVVCSRPVTAPHCPAQNHDLSRDARAQADEDE